MFEGLIIVLLAAISLPLTVRGLLELAKRIEEKNESQTNGRSSSDSPNRR